MTPTHQSDNINREKSLTTIYYDIEQNVNEAYNKRYNMGEHQAGEHNDMVLILRRFFQERYIMLKYKSLCCWIYYLFYESEFNKLNLFCLAKKNNETYSTLNH